MKKLFLLPLLMALLLQSCGSTVEVIANQELISNNEIKNTDGYVLKEKIEKTSIKEIKAKSKGNTTIEQAVSSATKDSLNISSYIRNAKIYMYSKDGWSKTNHYFYIEGEIWKK